VAQQAAVDTLLKSVTFANGIEVHRLDQDKMEEFKSDPVAKNVSETDDLELQIIDQEKIMKELNDANKRGEQAMKEKQAGFAPLGQGADYMNSIYLENWINEVLEAS